MQKIKRTIKKEDFNEIFRLYSSQSWLCDKEDSLIDLILLCETSEHKRLVINLLREFCFLDNRLLNNYLQLISDFIITDSGFLQETTQISAITFDDEADSSQKILDYIKTPLFKQGWPSVQTVNRYGAIPKNFKEGKKQIILIDEFVGSGQTILGRIKQLKNDIKEDFELKLCFVAGMDYGIKKIEELGYEVFCPLRLPKGISERFKDNELEIATSIMLHLESKLAKSINTFALDTYSFGYNGAEALYSLEECLGNTPNSVFPIFWWPRNAEDESRNTLLTRYEKGLK